MNGGGKEGRFAAAKGLNVAVLLRGVSLLSDIS